MTFMGSAVLETAVNTRTAKAQAARLILERWIIVELSSEICARKRLSKGRLVRSRINALMGATKAPALTFSASLQS